MARTRQALLDAFFSLVLKQPYDDIVVGDIIARAGVARSTFYEHFPGKDAILAASLRGPFSVLANAVRPDDNTTELRRILEHFWENRAQARVIMTGAMRRRSVAVLVRLIEERLKADASRRRALLIPAHLAAVQIAEALLAPVVAWVTAESACTVPRLATVLRGGALALTEALCGGPVRDQRARPGLR